MNLSKEVCIFLIRGCAIIIRRGALNPPPFLIIIAQSLIVHSICDLILSPVLRLLIFRRAELKPPCILLLVVTVTFFMPRFIYLCRTSFILVSSQRSVMLTHAGERTCTLKTFSEIEGQQAYSRRKDYFDHFSVAQVIIVRVLFPFFHF